jgi:uncharacterized protein YecA (UPF0149 family)
MINYRLKATVLEIVDNQIKTNDPAIVKETLDRLMGLGYSSEKSKEMIAAILLEEMYDMLKENQKYNEECYCKKLSMLPDYAGDDQENCKEAPELLQVRHEPKIGCNDPCPCGSGKKYKKCCGQ